jgi:hypothetical protein
MNSISKLIAWLSRQIKRPARKSESITPPPSRAVSHDDLPSRDDTVATLPQAQRQGRLQQEVDQAGAQAFSGRVYRDRTEKKLISNKKQTGQGWKWVLGFENDPDTWERDL